jgi:hypothetical protein
VGYTFSGSHLQSWNRDLKVVLAGQSGAFVLATAAQFVPSPSWVFLLLTFLGARWLIGLRLTKFTLFFRTTPNKTIEPFSSK